MIRGAVDGLLQPIIALRVRGPTGNEIDLDAIIDTGYTGALTLPYDVVSALGLSFHSEIDVTLADGSRSQYDVYTAEIEWNGVWQSVQISQVGSEVLVGMKLLQDHEIKLVVVPGGDVEITAIP